MAGARDGTATAVAGVAIGARFLGEADSGFSETCDTRATYRDEWIADERIALDEEVLTALAAELLASNRTDARGEIPPSSVRGFCRQASIYARASCGSHETQTSICTEVEAHAGITTTSSRGELNVA
jgi:hypothetical protein